jgi:hypothetical protein
MATNRDHRRFALHDVRVGGLVVGGATVDVWRDGTADRWCVRLLMPENQPVGDGRFEGTTTDGRRLRGTVRAGTTQAGTRRSVVMAELLGQGPLELAQDEVQDDVEAAPGVPHPG